MDRASRPSTDWMIRSTTACPEDGLSYSRRDAIRDTWLRCRTLLVSVGRIVRASPFTLVMPLLVFVSFVVSLEIGIWAAASSYRNNREDVTSNTVGIVARELDFLLQSFVAPTVAAAAAVTQTPHVPTIISSLHEWIPSIVKELSPNNATQCMMLFPWNIRAGTYPTTPLDIDMIYQDLNSFPGYKWTTLDAAGRGADFKDLVGPLQSPLCPPPGCFCARKIMWLPSSNPNETWGNEETYYAPWAVDRSGTPVLMGNRTINPKLRFADCGDQCSNYNSKPLSNGTWLTYWGFINHCVYKRSIMKALDYLASSGWSGILFNFVLYRKVDSSLDNPAYKLDTSTLGAGDVVIHASDDSYPYDNTIPKGCNNVGSGTSIHLVWTVCLSPVDGYEAPWKLALEITVAFFSFIVALLVFMLMVSRQKNKGLVQAMLPSKVVRCLGLGKTYAEPFQGCSILFSDIVSYTNLSSELAPNELVEMLDQLYLGYDDLVDKHQLYKVETIGDAFMAIGGAPVPCAPLDAAKRVGLLALDMIRFTEQFEFKGQRKIQIRIGIYTGNVTAAVMGRKMPHWTVVGDSVNMGSRMESNSLPNHIHIGSTTAKLLASFPDLFQVELRGNVDIKGKGPMSTFWLKPAAHPTVTMQLCNSMSSPRESARSVLQLDVHSSVSMPQVTAALTVSGRFNAMSKSTRELMANFGSPWSRHQRSGDLVVQTGSCGSGVQDLENVGL